MNMNEVAQRIAAATYVPFDQVLAWAKDDETYNLNTIEDALRQALCTEDPAILALYEQGFITEEELVNLDWGVEVPGDGDYEEIERLGRLMAALPDGVYTAEEMEEYLS